MQEFTYNILNIDQEYAVNNSNADLIYKLSLILLLRMMQRSFYWFLTVHIMNMETKQACFLAQQLRHQAASRIIPQIKSSSGSLVIDPKDINDTFLLWIFIQHHPYDLNSTESWDPHFTPWSYWGSEFSH